jgi:uncharacterized LabA/DUF88 family protein
LWPVVHPHPKVDLSPWRLTQIFRDLVPLCLAVTNFSPILPAVSPVSITTHTTHTTHTRHWRTLFWKDLLMFYRDERLALFIDGSNLYAAARALGFDIDYKLLRAEFMRRGKLLRAFYYTALLENDEYSPIRPLVDWLHYNGFHMVTKPAKEYTDAQGRRKVKGNMDIELTVDAMELAPHVDHIVLFSGDGDFRPMVEAVQRQGVRVSVVSTIRSQPPMISDDLRRQADNFIELDELKDVIGRPAREPREDDRAPAPALD